MSNESKSCFRCCALSFSFSVFFLRLLRCRMEMKVETFQVNVSSVKMAKSSERNAIRIFISPQACQHGGPGPAATALIFLHALQSKNRQQQHRPDLQNLLLLLLLYVRPTFLYSNKTFALLSFKGGEGRLRRADPAASQPFWRPRTTESERARPAVARTRAEKVFFLPNLASREP